MHMSGRPSRTKPETTEPTIMSVRERRFAVGLVEGKSATQAARDAGYAAGYRPEKREDMVRWISGILEEVNVTPSSLAEKLSEGLAATNVKLDADGGEHVHPDYFVRHKYVETALRLLDMEPPKRQEINTGSGGIVLRVTPGLSDNPRIYDDADAGA